MGEVSEGVGEPWIQWPPPFLRVEDDLPRSLVAERSAAASLHVGRAAEATGGAGGRGDCRRLDRVDSGRCSAWIVVTPPMEGRPPKALAVGIPVGVHLPVRTVRPWLARGGRGIERPLITNG